MPPPAPFDYLCCDECKIVGVLLHHEKMLATIINKPSFKQIFAPNSLMLVEATDDDIWIRKRHGVQK